MFHNILFHPLSFEWAQNLKHNETGETRVFGAGANKKRLELGMKTLVFGLLDILDR